MTSRTMLRACAAVIASALLASCGGGGGGGGSGSGVDSNNTFGLAVTLDRSTLKSMSLNGSAATADHVNLSISGGVGAYYIGVTADGQPADFDVEMMTTTAAEVLVKPNASTGAVGTSSTSQITFQLCRDTACAQAVWSRTIPMTVNRYRIDTDSIVLTGTESIPAAPVSLAITPPDTAHVFTFTSSNPAAMTVDHTDPAKVVLTMPTPRASTLSASLGIWFPGSDEVFTDGLQVPVQLTINSIITVPPVPPFVVKASTSAQSLAATAPVSFVTGQNQAWSAVSDKPWLVLDTAAGTGAGTLQFHVDPTKLDVTKNWASDVATISVSSPGLSTLDVAVSMLQQFPEISSSLPQAVRAGQPGTVEVTGRGLSQLADVSSLTVGGLPVSGGSIVSDTAATLQLPALPAGPARIAVNNALGAAAMSAPLVVEAAGTYTAATVPGAGLYRSVAFDPFRQALYSTNAGTDPYASTGNSLQRFQLAGSAWQVTTLALDKVGYVALSPDHGTVWVVAGTNLVAVDPDTMQVRSTIALPDGRSSADIAIYFGTTMPVTNDGRLWLNPSFNLPAAYYDLRTGVFGSLIPPAVPNSYGLYEPTLFATPGGTGMFMASCMCAEPFGPSYWYDVASGSFTHPDNIPALGEATFDEAGDLMVSGNNLYRTDTFAKVGQIDLSVDPARNSFYYRNLATVLSPDGRRAYSLVQPSMAQQVDHVAVLDTTTLLPGTDSFPLLGNIALPNKATTCAATNSGGVCDWSGRLVMDPAGSTLFWLGEQGLVVVPIPSSLMSTASKASRAHAAAAAATGGRFAGAASAHAH